MGNERATKIIRETVKRFKAHRQEQGLSHEVLARKAGITRPAVSHIEGGKRNPSLMVALRISHALGIELSDILDGVEQQCPRDEV